MNTPPTPEELWQELVDEAGEDLIAEADAMSVADAEAYLAKNGFDVQAERARARAFLDQLAGRAEERHGKKGAEAAAAPEPPAKRPATASSAGKEARKERAGGRRVSPAVLLAAAAVTAAGTGAAIYAAVHERGGRDEIVPEPSAPVPPPVRERDLVAARDLRAQAREAMGAGQPDVCLKLLDQAKAKDPSGDGAPDVITLRQQANDALAEPPPRRQGPK